jgi:hypothetical protein
VFVKDADILLSGDKWTIVVNIALDDCAMLITNMKMILNQVRQKIQIEKSPRIYSVDLYCEEIDRLYTVVSGLETDVKSFQRLLFEEPLFKNIGTTAIRTKRGLINVLWY